MHLQDARPVAVHLCLAAGREAADAGADDQDCSISDARFATKGMRGENPPIFFEAAKFPSRGSGLKSACAQAAIALREMEGR
jgi:hypothetical protein